MARSPAASQSDASAEKPKRPKPKKSKPRKRPRCQEKTKAGKRCTNPSKKGSKFCGTHASKDAGRPTKFTPETRAKVITFTQAANFKKQTCVAAGITEVTLANWLERGEADEAAEIENEFSEFFGAFRRAEAEGEVRLVAHLQKAAGDGSVRAQIELLKRRYRERWGDNVKVEIDDPAATPPDDSSIDPEKLTVEQRLQLADLLEAAAPDPPRKEP